MEVNTLKLSEVIENFSLPAIIITMMPKLMEQILSNIVVEVFQSNIVSDILSFTIPVYINIGISVSNLLFIIGIYLIIIGYIRYYYYTHGKVDYEKLIVKSKKKLRELLKREEYSMFSSIQFYKFSIKRDEDTVKIKTNGIEFITNDTVVINGLLQSNYLMDYDKYEKIKEINSLQEELFLATDDDAKVIKSKRLISKGNELKNQIVMELCMQNDPRNIKEKEYTLYRVLSIISAICKQVDDENINYLGEDFIEKEETLRCAKKTGLLGCVLQTQGFVFNNENSRNPQKSNRIYFTFRIDDKGTNIICLVSVNGTDLNHNDKLLKYAESIIKEIRRNLKIKSY